MNVIYIQIGSNIGDRISYINNSMQQIEDKLGKISNSSKIYETVLGDILIKGIF